MLGQTDRHRQSTGGPAESARMPPRGASTTASAAPPSRSDQDAAAPAWRSAGGGLHNGHTPIRRCRTPGASGPPSSKRADGRSSLPYRPDLRPAVPSRPWARACAVCGIGSSGVPRPSLAPYVTGTGATKGATAPPEDANVGYPPARITVVLPNPACPVINSATAEERRRARDGDECPVLLASAAGQATARLPASSLTISPTKPLASPKSIMVLSR